MTTPVPRRPTVQPVPAKAQPTCGSVRAIARVRLAPYLSREVFEGQLRAIPAVRSAVIVVGDVDYELRLKCRDLAHLEAVLSSLRTCRGTEVASTALVLRDVTGLAGGRFRSLIGGQRHDRATPGLPERTGH